jgi:hypothetical protein
MISDIDASLLPLQLTRTSLPREIGTVCQKEGRKQVSSGICGKQEKGTFIVERSLGKKCSFFPLLDFSKISGSLLHFIFSFTYELIRDSIVVYL